MSQRAERFARLLQQELGELLQRGIKDPRVSEAGLVTVTHVRVSDDLGVARVLVTLYGGDEAQRRALIAGLGSARPWLQAELVRRLRSKKMPELRFSLDETDDRAERVSSLLREIAVEDQARASAHGSGEPGGGDAEAAGPAGPALEEGAEPADDLQARAPGKGAPGTGTR